MFRISEIFVDDKDLPKVLRALDGLVFNMSVPQPVTNAVKEKGQVKQVGPAMTQWQRIWTIAHPNAKDGKITYGQIKHALIDCKIPKANMSSLVGQLIQRGVMKHTGTRGVYQVIDGKEKHVG